MVQSFRDIIVSSRAPRLLSVTLVMPVVVLPPFQIQVFSAILSSNGQ